MLTYKKIFYVDADACTGCKMCEMVCSLVHGDGSINPKRSRIRIIENPDKGIFIPQVCNICEDALCIDACPESALSREPKTKTIVIDKNSCTGCGLCAEACEYDAIFIDPLEDIATVCDLCKGKPKCVDYCLQKALIYSSVKEHSLDNNEKEANEEK